MPDSTSALINQLTNPPDPFARLGTAVQGVGALNQYRADQAAAEAYRQSIDPTTGQFDQSRFNAIASQAPGGSWNFGRQMQSAGQGLQAQSVGTSAQIEAQAAKLNGIAGQLYPLMQRVLNGETVTGAEMQEGLDRAKALGLTTPDMAANMQKHLDRIGPTGDANGVVRGAMYGTLTGAEKLRALTGAPVLVQQGPNASFVQPVPGAAQSPAGQVPMGLQPDTRAQIAMKLTEPHPFTDDDGKPHPTATLGDFLKYKGIDPYGVVPETAPPLPARVGAPMPGGPAAPAPGAPAAAPGAPRGGAASVTTGRVPVPPAAAGAAPAGQRGAVQPPPAIRPVEPSSGFSPQTLEAGQKAYTADLVTQRELPNRINAITSALSVLRANPTMQTVGQEELTALTQLGAAFGMPMSEKRLTTANAYQELKKYLAQATQAVPGSNRSDLGQTTAQEATPHIPQGREAMIRLLAKAAGVERVRAAAVKKFHSEYPTPEEAAKNSGQYLTKTNDFAARQDPNAWALDYMTVPDAQKYVKGLSKADKKRFYDSNVDALNDNPNIVLPP